MSSTQALPLLSSAIILIFAILVIRRFAARRGRHLLIWGIGLLLFGVAGLILAPVFHRLLHKFHFQDGSRSSSDDDSRKRPKRLKK